MNFYQSATYPECQWTDAAQTQYQSQLLLIECSDGTFELGFCIGGAGYNNPVYVNRRNESVKALAWAYVVHSEFYK